MKTRKQFKVIGVMIGTALCCLLFFQAYWLVGLYDTLNMQMGEKIREAMRKADYKELILRMKDVLAEENKDNHSFYFVSSSNDVGVYEKAKKTPSQQIVITLNDDQTGSISENDADSIYTELIMSLHNVENAVLKGLHNHFDSIKPIRHHVYDSLLTEELKIRQIDTYYQLYLVHKAQKNHIVFQTLRKNHPGMQQDTTAAALDWERPDYYEYPLYSNPEYYEDLAKTSSGENDSTMDVPFSYRLYIKSPAAVILWQMSNILLSSVLLLVLVILTFIYLFHTLLKQKTEEELKSDFTNNMTHELKTPISVSYAAVDSLLEYDKEVTGKQRKYLNIVKDQLQHLTGLVEQILTIAVENREGRQLKLQKINVYDISKHIMDNQLMRLGNSIDIALKVPEKLEVMADHTHLHNIINNLVDNAIKYGATENPRIEITAEEDDKEVRLSVSDNGSGISMAHQQRLFDKFYRIPKGNRHDVKGQGLGLYYIHDMMKKHGGSVSVDSLVGQGSTFTLHFKKEG